MQIISLSSHFEFTIFRYGGNNEIERVDIMLDTNISSLWYPGIAK